MTALSHTAPEQEWLQQFDLNDLDTAKHLIDTLELVLVALDPHELSGVRELLRSERYRVKAHSKRTDSGATS